MKVLIWFSTILIITTINLLIGYATGFMGGSIPLYLACYFTARALCKKWDKFKISRKASNEGLTSIQYIKDKVPTLLFRECEDIRENEEELKAVLKRNVKDRKISNVYADIIYDEYMKPKQKSGFINTVEKKNKEDEICFCRKCGEKLIDNSRFCRKCGTEVVKE